MCFQVYLGSYMECPEIPYAERSDDRTLFPAAYNIALFVHKHPEHSGFFGTVTGLTPPISIAWALCPAGVASRSIILPVRDGNITRNGS